jgi:hypothetical protein
MRLSLVFLAFFLFGFSTPDPELTPGSYCTPENPDFKEYRYAEQIPWCQRNVSSFIKEYIYDSYGVIDSTFYTIDHLIPLSLGGSNHIDNLWPQHDNYYSGGLEYRLYIKIRDGELTRKQAVDVVLKFKLTGETSGY